MLRDQGLPMKRLSERLFDAFFNYIFKHPCGVLAVIAVLTVLAASQLHKVRVMTDLKSMVPRDEVFHTNQTIIEQFDLHDYIIVGITHSQNAFRTETLEYLRALSRKTESIDGVYLVRSLLTEDNIRNTEKGLSIGPFITDISSESVGKLQEEIERFPAVQGTLASSDGTCVSLSVELEDGADKNYVYRGIRDFIHKNPPPHGEEIHLSGVPVFEGVLGNQIFRDLSIMLPIVSVVIVALLYLAYRSMFLVCISIIEVLLVNIWTLGLMGYLKVPFYTLHTTMPVILMALAVADEIHIFSRYCEECENANVNLVKRLISTMRAMWPPVVLTSVTTALGFLSFLATSMEPLQYFGVFTAAGVIFAMIFSLTITPIGLMLTRYRSVPRCQNLSESLAKMAVGLYVRRRVWLCVLSIFVVAAAIELKGLYVQDSWVSNFRKNSAVCMANDVLRQKLLGTRTIHLELDTGRDGGVKEAAFLGKAASFQERLAEITGIGGSVSAVQLIKKMNKEFTGQYEMPDRTDVIAQFFFLLEGSSYETFWGPAYRKMRVSIFCRRGDYQTGTVIYPSIKAISEEYLPDVKLRFGGDFTLSYNWCGLLVKDQIKSLLTAFLLILTASSVFFGSLRKGLIVLLPIVLAVLFNFGVMGLFNIPLSVSTSLFSSIILGVGIDYVIHLQSKFDASPGTESMVSAIHRAFGTAGEAIFWDAVVVAAGFLVLLFSEMPPSQKLGLIVVLGIANSIGSSFLIIALFATRRSPSD